MASILDQALLMDQLGLQNEFFTACQAGKVSTVDLIKFLEAPPCVTLIKLLREKSIHSRLDEVCEKLQLKDPAPLTLAISASLLQLFVIDNFVGPTNENYQTLQNEIEDDDCPEVYHKIENPWLLRLVQRCWDLLSSLKGSSELEFLVWKHRYLTVHSMVLLEPVEHLTSELRTTQDRIWDQFILQSQPAPFNIVELCCELLQSAILIGRISSARKFCEHACVVSGVSIEHTGVLGKRTRFQQNNVPQLVVKISKAVDPTSPEDGETSGDLPKDVKLDDDTLLPDISFVEKDENGEHLSSTEQSLNVESQLLMLGKLDLILKTEVMEESLKDEWTLAYLRSIVRSASTWPIKFKALTIRSSIERKHMRKMDRALLQMEELIKTVGNNTCGKANRLQTFYSVLPFSHWQIQRTLGDISIDMGLYKNALDQYTRIEYWEGIIKCYAALGQTVKAEKIIRQELEKKETPYLYCLLGDATENIEYYEKSWTLSNGRFSRAKKSIGTYFYVRKQYDEAITNYELALNVNPSNTSVLALMGYSCLLTERYEKAAECYRNITYNDDTNFLAWNNLSKAYIKLNQKERAWRTLREALKCNYEEWKIWENFMLVSIELGAIEDVITAWHRLIDIKSSHKDDQILSALTHTLVTKPSGEADSEYMKLLSDALKLVARLNSTSDCSPRLWICYFKLLIKEFELMKLKSEQQGAEGLSNLDVDSRVSKITNALQRATPTALIADPKWYQVPEKISRVLDSYNELADCYQYAFQVLGERPELCRQLKYFKLSEGNAKKMIEKQD